MAKCPIYKIGGGVDLDDLTAVPSDVISPNTFMGSGSYDEQSGSMIGHGNINYELPINANYQLPEGYYTGGKIYQDIITLGQQNIELGPNDTTIQTLGKYMTGNIIVYPASNLTSSNIKKGVKIQVGDQIIEGTWEGYINTDPFTPYFYGTFNGIQSITAFKYKLYDNPGTVSFNKDNIQVYVKNNLYYTAVVFDNPIDVTNKTKLTVRLQNSKSAIQSISLYRNKVTDYIFDNASSTNLKINPNLGTEIAGINTSGSGGDYIVNVANVTGNVYVYLFFINPVVTSNIYMVRFE